MGSKGKFVPELVDEKWLMDLAFVVHFTTLLIELNVSPQSEI